MFGKKRQIDPAVRRTLDAIGEDVVRAKLPWIMNVTSLRSAAVASDQEGGEPLGDNLSAPLWAIQQWLAEKDARRQRWVKAAAILAGFAVVVALLAWFFPITDRRPELASTGGDINLATHVAELQWRNIGAEPAIGGTVTIFAFGSGRRQVELGKGDLIGAGGPNVMPSYNGSARIDFSSKQLGDRMLACLIYFDDEQRMYPRAFLYHQDPMQNNAIHLSELPPPRPKYNAVCL